MKKIKKVCCISLLITACSLTACSGNNKKTDESATVSAVESAKADSTDSAEAASDSSSESSSENASEMTSEGSSEGKTENGTDETLKGQRKRRVLPGEKTEIQEQDTNTEKKEIEYPSSVSEIRKSATNNGGSVMFTVKKNIEEKKISKTDDSFPDSDEDMQDILYGMMSYWENGDMEAVEYLMRMDKYRYLSQMLNGSDDYFYVGEENSDNEPNGKGIACYADNAYYYGYFLNGERCGDGVWYQVFTQDGNYSKENNGILSHSYKGEWANDLPNGKGQEHIEIDETYLQDRIVDNVATDFVDGYYNGDVIATSIDKQNGRTNWQGAARYGKMVVFENEAVKNKNGKSEVRVLQNADEGRENNYFWMLEDENCGQGITGLIN